MRSAFTLEQADRIARALQYLVGFEIFKGKPETAIKYIVIGPYNYNRHEQFANRYHRSSTKQQYVDPDGQYDVLGIVVCDMGKVFVIDVRMLIEQYNIPCKIQL